MKLFSLYSSQEFDKLLAYSGIISSLILFIFLNVSIGRFVFSIIPLLSFFSCILWIYLRNSASLKFDIARLYSINFVLISLFLVLFSLSIFALHLRPNLYERPLLYFIFISFMVGVIALEILFCDRKQHHFILIQIIILGILTSWPQLLIFKSLVGLDPWYHQNFTLNIINSHTIPLNLTYSKIPLFQLFIGMTSLITTFDYKFSTMLSASLSHITCNVMFIYLLANYLFTNNKVGLFSSLFLIIANNHIFMSYSSIPNSFAAVFMLPVFYLSLKVKHSSPFSTNCLLLLLIPAIILSHSITSLCMAIIIVVFWFSSHLYNIIYFKTKIQISLTYIILFIVFMFSWWIYASGHLRTFSKLIKWGFSTDVFVNTPQNILLDVAYKIPISEQIFNNIGMFLFFSFSFIGFFYMISKKYGNCNTFSIAFVGITPLVLSFFSLISHHSIVEHRWWYFSQIFLSIPLSISFLLLCNKAKSSAKLIILIALIVPFSFTLIMNPYANIDNHLFSPHSINRAAFTDSELCSIYTISGKCAGPIGGDRYLPVVNFLPIEINIVPIDYELYSGDFNNTTVDFILIRDYIEHNTFQLYNSAYQLKYSPTYVLNNQMFGKVYDSKSIILYKN